MLGADWSGTPDDIIAAMASAGYDGAELAVRNAAEVDAMIPPFTTDQSAATAFPASSVIGQRNFQSRLGRL